MFLLIYKENKKYCEARFILNLFKYFFSSKKCIFGHATKCFIIFTFNQIELTNFNSDN